jgi:hypothetical protein
MLLEGFSKASQRLLQGISKLLEASRKVFRRLLEILREYLENIEIFCTVLEIPSGTSEK